MQFKHAIRDEQNDGGHRNWKRMVLGREKGEKKACEMKEKKKKATEIKDRKDKKYKTNM